MESAKIYKDLIKFIKKDNIKTDELYRKAFSYDATGIEYAPDIIVFPETEDQISGILKYAYNFEIPVTPRGSGAGFTGGSIPVKGGILICLSKMNRIIGYDKDSSMLELEPGVLTAEINRFAEPYGTFYPVDPASMEFSTIGGNIAENAGGPRAVKYGTTKEYVLGLNLVLPNGEIIKTGSKTIKNVAGYDLTSLLTGSEGTLGIISRINLRLIPIPEAKKICMILFRDKKQAAQAITALKSAGIMPSCLEFLDKKAYYYAKKPSKYSSIKDIDACVLLEWDGDKSSILYQEKRIFEIINKMDILEIIFPDENLSELDIWALRRSVSPAIVKLGKRKINEDIVVPISKIPEAIDTIYKIADKYHLEIINFGHLGDGNIHANIIIKEDSKEENERAEKCLENIFNYVISIDGSISGEHGIGITKRQFLSYQYNELEIDIMKKIKNIFDPKGIMNPAKIFE